MQVDTLSVNTTSELGPLVYLCLERLLALEKNIVDALTNFDANFKVLL